MCLPFLNLSVRYDTLLRGWCVAYVADVNVLFRLLFQHKDGCDVCLLRLPDSELHGITKPQNRMD
jgi:hypothetical protein